MFRGHKVGTIARRFDKFNFTIALLLKANAVMIEETLKL